MLQCTLARYVRHCIANIFQLDGRIVLDFRGESDNFRYSHFAVVAGIELAPQNVSNPWLSPWYRIGIVKLSAAGFVCKLYCLVELLETLHCFQQRPPLVSVVSQLNPTHIRTQNLIKGFYKYFIYVSSCEIFSPVFLNTYLLTYLLHAAESFLWG
jgi:hypothetical protein